MIEVAAADIPDTDDGHCGEFWKIIQDRRPSAGPGVPSSLCGIAVSGIHR
jgi:hypothetical protein